MSKKKFIKISGAAVISLLLLWLFKGQIACLAVKDPMPAITDYFKDGGAYTDRHGELLRAVPNSRGDYILEVPLSEQSKDLINAVITAEDRNFRNHPGFDIFAILRAACQNLYYGRIISGASTITQQLIRISRPSARTWSAKLFEFFSAIRLEQTLNKDQILEKYLNSVCLFGNVRGTAMASALLFGKSPAMLNLAESATLAAAIQAPGRYNPFTKKGNQALMQRRARLLNDMLKEGFCSKKDYDAAINDPIPTYKKRRTFNAPHFCDYAEKHFGQPKGTIKTTIDLEIQNRLAQILKSHRNRLARRGAHQSAALIIDSDTSEILAMCGSTEYGPIAGGFNNGTDSPRSGGSVLKPFLYALAFEKGYYPSYVLSDTILPYKTLKGEYLPENAKRADYGPVTMRNALGNSLNISAVKTLNKLGLNDFYSLLTDLDILKYKEGEAAYLGLGLAIGNPEIKMLNLAQAFSIFSNKGIMKSLKFFLNQNQTKKSIITPESAAMIFDILSDETARLFTFGNPDYFKTKHLTAIKTGTSTSYRDSWLIADDCNYIIAIWVGNFTGEPTLKLSGSSACGPIFKDISKINMPKSNIVKTLFRGKTEKRKVCALSGQKPSENCPSQGEDWFKIGSYDALPSCSFHKKAGESHELSPEYASWLKQRSTILDSDPFKLASAESSANNGTSNLIEIKIASPHHGDRFVYSSYYGCPVHLRAIPNQPVKEIVWFIDDFEYVRTEPPYEAIWPGEKGEHRITALAVDGTAETVIITVE